MFDFSFTQHNPSLNKEQWLKLLDMERFYARNLPLSRSAARICEARKLSA
jgi:hypothetical protein